ncbi:hypothetical protein ASG97_09010 [Bacillus sp. Soil745]|nr:hypothetical protein ASG97_09010 [Bacillus sp. Soil745]
MLFLHTFLTGWEYFVVKNNENKMQLVFTALFLLAGIKWSNWIIIRPSYSLLLVIFYIVVYSITINCGLIKKYFKCFGNIKSEILLLTKSKSSQKGGAFYYVMRDGNIRKTRHLL